MVVLGGHSGFLTRDMEDRVIPDVMSDVYLPQGRYPENFKLISLLKVCQEGGYLEDVGGFLTGDMEDSVIPDIMNDVFLPQGRYPENFVSISQLEVFQEGGVKKGGTWRTLGVPDRRQQGHGHS